MLDPFSRGAIVALTALCVFGAIELAPIPARSFGDETARQSGRLAVTSAAANIGSIIPIRRDPFAEPGPGNAPVPNSNGTAEASLRTPIGTLPGNLVSDSIPGLPGAPSDPSVLPDPKIAAPPAVGSRVTAIVTGAHPYAMIETDGTNEIKGIGDRVGGSAIVAIDIGAVRLQNGARLNVDPAARP